MASIYNLYYYGKLTILGGTMLYNSSICYDVIKLGYTVVSVTYIGTRAVYKWVFVPERQLELNEGWIEMKLK